MNPSTRVIAKMHIQNTIIYLIGYPAAGKLSVAKKLSELTQARLIDNHTINNPIFQIVRSNDGHVVFTDEIIEKVRAIRHIVLDTIENIAETGDSFIFTNVLVDTPSDTALYSKIKGMAEKRGNRFVPVLINCAEKELMNRVQSTERQGNLKLTRAERLKEILRDYDLLPIEHRYLFEIDNTDLSVEECAYGIANYLDELT